MSFFIFTEAPLTAMEHYNADDNMKSRTVTLADDGSEIDVAAGELLKVELVVQGGTGYDWHNDGLDRDHLELVETATEQISDKRPAGGPVKKTWLFKAVASGGTELNMAYYRVWEGNGSSSKRFKIKLNIH